MGCDLFLAFENAVEDDLGGGLIAVPNLVSYFCQTIH